MALTAMALALSATTVTATLTQQAYLKASNTGGVTTQSSEGDGFGCSVAVSGDTLVVGANGEDSSATGVNGNQNDNSAPGSGAAYVFARTGTNWIQQAYLKAPNIAAGFASFFGSSVAISGETIVVGAPDDFSRGSAYVFVRNGTNWTPQATLTASNGGMSQFGSSVAITGDTIVVGAPEENNLAFNSGAAYVFVRNGTSWIQQAYLKASNPGASDYFGYKVAVSGETLVIGAFGEDSSATGVNGNQSNNSASFAGAAYIFARDGTNWTQQAYLKASNTGPEDRFGAAVSLSGDTVVVGANLEGSNSTGVNGSQINNNAPNSGAVYVFVRSGTNWTQQAYLKASNTEGGIGLFNGDRFGWSVSLSGDILVVGADKEFSSAIGVDGNQSDNSAPMAGAAYVFVRRGTNWSQRAYLKASNTEAGDQFGTSVAVSSSTVVIGAFQEDSQASGANGDQTDNSASDSGSAYVFTGASLLAPEPPPNILTITRAPGGDIVLTAEAAPGRSYTLQASEHLTAWTDLATQSASTNRIEFTDVPTDSPTLRFYRVKQN